MHVIKHFGKKPNISIFKNKSENLVKKIVFTPLFLVLV